MGRKKQPGPTNGSGAKPPQSGSSAASLLLKGKALLGRRPQDEEQHDSGSGSPASSINEGSGGSVDGTSGGNDDVNRRPRHGGLGPSRLQEEEGVPLDAEITPESSPGSSKGEEGSSPLALASPPLAPPTIADAAAAPAPAPAPASVVVVPPPPSPTPSLTLSEVPGHSASSSRYEAALWALLGAVRRGEGEGEVVDAALLDKLLSLGRLAFDPSVHAGSGATSPPRGGSALGWYARLLEAVAESELGAPPCALHRARIGAVFQCAAFFCRLKASGGGRQSPPSKPQPQAPQDGDSVPFALADVPPLCRGELRRRLGTLLASLQCPRALARKDVDAMRRDDLLIALRWLESPLAPLDITLRSVLLPLLEGMCKDVLMAGALGEEVNTRLELELSALDEEQQQHATPTLWRAADSVFRLAAGGIRGRLAKGRAPPASTTTDEGEQQEQEGNREQRQRQQKQDEEQEPPPPPSQLAADAAPRVADILAWLRTEKAALACRHSSGLEELLAALPRTLRASLRAQVYEGPGDFIRVFEHHEASLHALPLPPSSTPCLPMPPSSPPRGRSAAAAAGGFRECHGLAPGVAQALKDIGRERFLLEGEPVSTPGEVQVLLAELLGRRGGVQSGGAHQLLPKGLEAALQRCLCAASRTTFGGDVFFIVRDLFGGDGVVVAPLSVKRARGPVLSPLDQHEDKDGGHHGGGQENGGTGNGGGGESPVEIRVVGGSEGSGSGVNGRPGAVVVLKVLITSRTAYGLYADELAGSASGSGSGGGLSEQVRRQLGLQEHEPDSGGFSPGRRRSRRRSLTHPMITLHATLVETIPVLVTNNPSTAQTELRVLARGGGAGRMLKLRAERPPSPSPSPPPIFAVYPEDAAAAGGGGPPPPPRDNDEISV